MQPDDLIEIEFPTPSPVRVMAAVRNRSGYSFGLEFLAVPGHPGALPGIFFTGRGSCEFWASRLCLGVHWRL